MKKLCTTIAFTVYTLAVVFAGTAFAETNCTGWAYYDSDLETCVTCENSGFTITTTSLAANTNFWFTMSPKGSFAVDWGDGTIDNIDRSNTTVTDYPHTYTNGGIKTIKFCGRATEYNSAAGDSVVAAISFYKNDSTNTSKWITSVSGSMGSVFPTVSNTPAGQPRFRSTFQGASSLTTISANLFSGVSGSAEGMFRSTFDKSGLKAIPYGLFAGITGGAPNMFRSTFYQCRGVTSLPDDLFAGITVAAQDEFRFTFYQASSLSGEYIPASAFIGLVNAGSPQPETGSMWYQTFDGTGLLKACPPRTQPFDTGYEGSVTETSWNGYVACEPDNPCKGAEYWDSTNEVCVPCPGDYVYDMKNTKISINECKIQCSAGTYLANAGDLTCTNAGVGYYATGGVFSYGQSSSRTQCPDNMPTINNTTTASDVEQCVVHCRGIQYRNPNNLCVDCPPGYDDDDTDGKNAIADCKIFCDGGTYLPTANASSCEDVGDGYWSVATTVAYGSTVSRNKCPIGQTTGMTNASSASQCREALCTGATYRDSVTGQCVSCPIGYDAHTVSGKTSISECQIHCYAGTYIANANDTVCTNVGDGYYAAASDVNYGSTGSRGQCPSGQLTGTQTAASSSLCQTSCIGVQYYDSATGSCQDCPTGYTDNITNGKNSINQCQAYCAGGTVFATYTPLEYLQSRNGNQFIDTGYGVTSDHVHGTVVIENLEAITNPSQYDSGNFFGNLYGKGGFSSGWKKNVFGVWLQKTNGGGAKAQYSAPLNQNQVYTIKYDITLTLESNNKKSGVPKITVDNNSPKTANVPDVSINYEGNTIKLFTNGSAFKNGNSIELPNGDKIFGGRMYSMQLYDDGVLKLDLIPARRESDGELGMYNRVDGDFYVNAGFDTFIAGADSGDSFGSCGPVGNGYYVGATYTNYGTVGTRNKCPNGAPTMENNKIINNASSIYQCGGVEPCEGAMYPDPGTGICTLCPTNYISNTQNGKESIYECQIHCEPGTYLANANDASCINVGNGYYTDDSLINWGDVGTRTRCPNGGVTNMTNAATADACVPIGTCSGATYMNSGTCEPCPTGYTANTINGKTAATDCQMVCPVGSYLATANTTTCTDAGAGYWATGGVVNYGSTSIKNACATGLTTVGYGHGADEASDCGRKLHLGDFILYTKTTKPTLPAINVRVENDSTTHYVGVSDTDHTLTPIHVTQGETQYTAFDDSILYGERDLETNTRITQ